MLLTRANPEQAERLRKLIAGESAPRKAAAPKRKQKRPVQLVSQYVAPLRGGGWCVQLPMYLAREMYNTGGKGAWVKRAMATKQIETTLLALRSLLKLASARDEDRAAIRGVTFVRISPSTLDDDNLVSAFKHVRDATFAWIVCGERDVNMKTIGHYDQTVKTGRHTCRYEQTKCESNPRAHGIQILLHV